MAAPANDNIANALTLAAGTTQVTGTTAEATVESGERRLDGGGTTAFVDAFYTVWFRWWPPSTSPATITTVGSAFDTYLSIYRADSSAPTVSTLVPVASDDDGGDFRTSSVTFTPAANTWYYIQISGYDVNAKGAYRLNYPSPGNLDALLDAYGQLRAAASTLPGDLLSGAIPLMPGTTQITGSSAGASGERGEVRGASDSAHITTTVVGTIWATWVAPSSSSATITTVGSNYDTYLTIFQAASGISDPVYNVSGLQIVASNDDGGASATSSVTFTPVAGRTYYLQIDSFTGTNGTYVLNYPSPGTAAATHDATATLAGSGAMAAAGDNLGQAESLFTTQTPTIIDASDGTPGITTATTFRTAVDGQITAARFYATTTVSGTYMVGLWTVDSNDPGGGTLLASATMSSTPTPGTWNTVPISPVSVTAGVAYRVGAFSGAGRYVATTGFFSTTDLVSGNLTADATGDTVGGRTITQGTFRIDAAFGYPNANGGGTSYFVDVDFYPSAGGPVTHNGAVTFASAGALTGAATRGTGTTATLAATGVLTVTGVRAQNTATTLAGTGGVSAAGLRSADGTATLAATGSLTGTAARTQATTAVLAGLGGLTVVASTGGDQSAILTGVGSLTAAGERTAVTTATVSATGALTATAAVTSPGAETATLTASGTLTATAGRTAVTAATLAAVGGLTGTAARAQATTISLAGQGTLTAAAAVEQVTLVTFAGTAGLQAVADISRHQTAALPAVGALTATAQTITTTTVTLPAGGVLTAVSGTTHAGVVTFAAVGALTAATSYRRRPGRFTTGSRRSTIITGSVRADTYRAGGIP